MTRTTPLSNWDVNNPVYRDFAIPLGKEGIAVLRIPVPMTPENFKQLKKVLRVMRPGMIRPEPPAVPADLDKEAV